MSKIRVLGLLGICLSAVAFSKAEGLGIGVTPAKVEIGQNVEWPYTVSLMVTNFSTEAEKFDVLFEKDAYVAVSVVPGRFSLESGERGHVLVTFEEPRRPAQGLIKIVSTRTSPEGFTTGTGVKIPFQIEKGSDTRFLAGIGEAFEGVGFLWLFGAGMIFATLLLLWQISAIVRIWIFNSDKH